MPTNRLSSPDGAPAVSLPGPHFTWPVIGPEQEAAVLAQLRRATSIHDGGGVFAELEGVFAAEHGASRALLANSGTSALHCLYFALGLRPGDNVVVPDYTYFATVAPLLFFPVDIRFCDCDESGNLDAGRLADLIDERTRAVVVTHMWGIPADMDAIARACAGRGVPVIEDCSHAHGAVYRGRRAGTFGLAAAWSLQGQKLVSGGEGGVLTTSDEALFADALLLGHNQSRCRDQVAPGHPSYALWETGFGLNLRAHPLSAALALSVRRALPEALRRRRAGADRLMRALSPFPFLRLPVVEGREPSWHAFTARFDPQGATGVEPDEFVRAVQAEGAVEVHRPEVTRDCSRFPIFGGWPDPRVAARSSNARDPRPRAAEFHRTAVRVPVPSVEADEAVFSQYVAALVRVCERVARQ